MNRSNVRVVVSSLVVLSLGACLEDTGSIEGQLSRFQGSAAPLWSGTTYETPALLQGPGAAPLRRTLAGLRRYPLLKVPKGRQVVPGEVIVRTMGAGVLPQSLEKVATVALDRLRFTGFRVTHRGFGSDHLHLLLIENADGTRPGAGETELLARALATMPGVKFAEPNLLQFPTAVPNDALYSLQWHYPAMGLPAAWDVTTGAASVVVAVVDTGVVAHPQLAPKLVQGIDMISDASRAQDGNGRDDDPTDVGRDQPNNASSWHGTHVAGTIGARTDDGAGVAGVAWATKVQAVRVLGKGGGTLFDIASGITWATGGNVPNARVNATPAKVVNMSLGGDSEPLDTYQDAIDGAVSRGAIVVVAAGNEDESTVEKVPCNQASVICVGATRFSGRRASYSNFGAQVDVMAPGGELAEDANGDDNPDGVLSTYWDGEAASQFLQGTSMATPHVAGLVALLAAVKTDLNAASAEQLVKESTSGRGRCDAGCGSGMVNAHAAVMAARGQQPSGPAKLQLSTSDVLLRGSAPSTFGITNSGGQALSVEFFVDGTEGSRLRTPEAAFSVPVGETKEIELSADVEGLADGTHAARLVVQTNGGNANVNVRIVAGAASDGKDAIVAIVFQQEDGEWGVVEGAEGTTALAADEYRWKVEGLPPNTYYALAGIDLDGDEEYFEPGEPVGFYPTFAQPTPIVVEEAAAVTGIDFALIPFRDVDEAPPVEVGTPCLVDGDCAGEGAFCIAAWAGGYCSRLCVDAACPGGTKCFGEGDALFCLATCTGPGEGRSDCRSEYVCYDDFAGSALCFPGCSTNADCGEGTTCQASGYCE